MMSFRFYKNAISQASRAFATSIFIIGMVLIGFGFMIYLLPKFFATLAAIVFFVAGIGCAITAVRIFLAQKRLDKVNSDGSQDYRENVQIHIEEHFDA
jgi:F0F1-type ATP synthase assembly protein I